MTLTFSWFSNIICHWLILIHLNFHLYLHKISFWPVFFNYLPYFAVVYISTLLGTDFTLRKVLRKRSRIRISLQNELKLSYESIEKAESLNKYCSSISNLNDENKVLPDRSLIR
jgi:hypothetical protein